MNIIAFNKKKGQDSSAAPAGGEPVNPGASQFDSNYDSYYANPSSTAPPSAFPVSSAAGAQEYLQAQHATEESYPPPLPQQAHRGHDFSNYGYGGSAAAEPAPPPPPAPGPSFDKFHKFAPLRGLPGQGQEPEEPERPPALTCTLCEVTAETEEAYDAHLSSFKHLKRTKQVNLHGEGYQVRHSRLASKCFNVDFSFLQSPSHATHRDMSSKVVPTAAPGRGLKAMLADTEDPLVGRLTNATLPREVFSSYVSFPLQAWTRWRRSSRRRTPVSTTRLTAARSAM